MVHFSIKNFLQFYTIESYSVKDLPANLRLCPWFKALKMVFKQQILLGFSVDALFRQFNHSVSFDLSAL